MPLTIDLPETFCLAAYPQRIRTFCEFAEQELILPTGPRAGLPFRSDFMPWTKLVLAEFDAGRYRRFFGAGPAQSGKTLVFFIIPTLYHLFEVVENVIVGVPKIDMAQSIYEERLLPAIQRSRYAGLLPRKGSGSRGGKFLSVRMGNGALLRFMGAGGGDEQRASHTARIVVLTEIDMMDVAGKASRQADPISQIEARSNAYGDRARLYAECVMTTREGRTHQEVVEFGTDTRAYLLCPHCKNLVYPDREHFMGWQEAADVLSARDNAILLCPDCGASWNEADRAIALTKPVLVSKGQEVAKGTLEGDSPRTHTFGFRWNAIHSPLSSMANIAEAEWRAAHSDNPADMKAVLQFRWALPYEEELVNLSEVSRDLVLKRIGHHPKGVAPDDTQKISVFIDLGMYRCWWAACAWRADVIGYVIDYGALDVPQERQANPLAILGTLRAFRDDVLAPGWLCGGKQRAHDMCLIDSSWQSDVAYQFVKESSQPRYLAMKGLGTGRNQQGWHPPKPGPGRQVAQEWAIVMEPNAIRLVHLHSDHWKRTVHQGFAAPMGSPGSLQAYKAEERDHLTFARQIAAERQQEEFVPGRGTRIFWNQVVRDNHYLDCVAGCRAAAELLGIRLMEERPQKAEAQRETIPPVTRERKWKIGR